MLKIKVENHPRRDLNAARRMIRDVARSVTRGISARRTAAAARHLDRRDALGPPGPHTSLCSEAIDASGHRAATPAATALVAAEQLSTSASGRDYRLAARGYTKTRRLERDAAPRRQRHAAPMQLFIKIPEAGAREDSFSDPNDFETATESNRRVKSESKKSCRCIAILQFADGRLKPRPTTILGRSDTVTLTDSL